VVNRVNGRQADVSRALSFDTVLPYLGYGLSIINIHPHLGQRHSAVKDDAVCGCELRFFRVRVAMFEKYSARRSPKVYSTVNLATIAGFEGRTCLIMEHRDLHFWCDPPPGYVDNRVWSPPQQLLNSPPLPAKYRSLCFRFEHRFPGFPGLSAPFLDSFGALPTPTHSLNLPTLLTPRCSSGQEKKRF
jgi:hypothetical protein